MSNADDRLIHASDYECRVWLHMNILIWWADLSALGIKEIALIFFTPLSDIGWKYMLVLTEI